MSCINISARPFNLKLKHPFGISRGTVTLAKNVLVTVQFDDIVAYGEAAPSSYYGEDQNSVMQFIKAFIKTKRLEEYITNIHKLKNDLDNFHMTSYSARAALEIAFWDLIGKIQNKPLYEFFFQENPFAGGNGSGPPSTSFTIGLDSLTVIEEKVNEALQSGFNILKVKLGKGFDEDINILKTVNKAIKNKKCVLRVDANGGWDLETTNKMLDILPEYNVEFLEQPLPRGMSHLIKNLLEKAKIPIFVDEDCIGINDIESLAGCVNGINIKLMKTGSLIEAINMINLAKSYNLKIILGCMIESSCSISAAVHLSPLADYIDLDGHLLIEDDPFSGLTLEENNKILPSFADGLGIEPS